MPKLDLSLTPDEVDAYLASQRTIRVATSDPGGVPHVVPLWFVWYGGSLYLNTTLGNLTVENWAASGRATGVVDDGESYDALRGVVLMCRVVPADEDAAIPQVERAWSEKYLGGNEVPYRRWRNRAWFRLDPDRITSWDFRKIPEARARREQRMTEG